MQKSAGLLALTKCKRLLFHNLTRNTGLNKGAQGDSISTLLFKPHLLLHHIVMTNDITLYPWQKIVLTDGLKE